MSFRNLGLEPVQTRALNPSGHLVYADIKCEILKPDLKINTS